MNNFDQVQQRTPSEAELNYNKQLTRGAETSKELGELATEIRRKATSIMPHEIELIQDEKVKKAIEDSFIKVGQDIGTLAGIIEKMIEHQTSIESMLANQKEAIEKILIEKK